MRACLPLAFILLCIAPISAQQVRDENEVVFVHEKDPAMVAAIREARATLDEFLKRAASPTPGTSGYKLKVLVVEGSDGEHFWVEPFRQTAEGFEGILANEARVVRSVRWGQKLIFSQDQITDWGYVRDGKQIGSYTVCVLLKRMPQEQADYYRRNHGFVC